MEWRARLAKQRVRSSAEPAMVDRAGRREPAHSPQAHVRDEEFPVNGTPLDFGLLILRLATSAMMVVHGFGKARQLWDGDFDFPDPLGMGSMASLIMATFAEFLCAILVGVGIRVRLAAIPVCITMLVAAFVVHRDDPFSSKEHALLFAVPYLTLALTGGGKYCLETFFARRR